LAILRPLEGVCGEAKIFGSALLYGQRTVFASLWALFCSDMPSPLTLAVVTISFRQIFVLSGRSRSALAFDLAHARKLLRQTREDIVMTFGARCII